MPATDEVAAAQLGGPGERLAPVRSLRQVGRDFLQVARGRNVRVEDQVGALAAQPQGKEVQVVLAQDGPEGPVHLLAHLRPAQVLCLEAARHLARERRAPLPGLVEVGVHDLLRGLGEPVHRVVEPPVHAALDQVERRPEDDPGRHQPQEQQREDQLGAEARAEDAAPPFHDRLDQVAHQERDQGQDEEEVRQQEDPQQDRVRQVRPGEVGGLAQQQVAAEEDHEQGERAELDQAVDADARPVRTIGGLRAGCHGRSLP